jgi:arylsulfatase A-like enzyme
MSSGRRRHRRLLRVLATASIAAAGAWLAWRWVVSPAPPRVIVLISIDTLRADALGSYGNSHGATPYLDSLAADGVRFAQAFAQSPWTIPSHASLLTSLYPPVAAATAHRALPPSAITLPEVLRDAGYETGAIVNVDYLGRKFGFDQGFDEFHERLIHRGAAGAVDAALAFLQRSPARRVFLFLHVFDVHGPYADGPRAGAAGEPDATIRYLQRIRYHDYLQLDRFEHLADVRAAYDAGVRRVDVELGRLFADLRRRGLYDEALIVVTADHGEAFFEHRIWVGHGLFLYDNELRIPMILKLPARYGAAGTVVDTPASLVDVMPTIMEVAGLASAPSVQGHSLLAFVNTRPADRRLLGHSTNTGYTEFVRSQRWKFIGPVREEISTVMALHLKPDDSVTEELAARIAAGPQLYDLTTDPGETVNVAAEHPDVVEAMEQLLAAQRRRNALHRERFLAGGTPTAVDLTVDDHERLRQLGYEP